MEDVRPTVLARTPGSSGGFEGGIAWPSLFQPPAG